MLLVDGMECGIHLDDTCPVMRTIVFYTVAPSVFSQLDMFHTQPLHVEDVTSSMYICVVASYSAKLNDALLGRA